MLQYRHRPMVSRSSSYPRNWTSLLKMVPVIECQADAFTALFKFRLNSKQARELSLSYALLKISEGILLKKFCVFFFKTQRRLSSVLYHYREGVKFRLRGYTVLNTISQKKYFSNPFTYSAAESFMLVAGLFLFHLPNHISVRDIHEDITPLF